MLSIIVPVYNVEKYLSECIDSLLAQDYRDFEIILVDDGSIDLSPSICDKYEREHAQIRTIHKSNGGLPSARNAGLEIAKGKYVSFIDSDDLVDEHMFSILISMMEIHLADSAVCNYRFFDKTNSFDGKRHTKSIIDYSENTLIEFYNFALDGCTNKVFLLSTIKKHGIRFVSKKIVSQEDFLFQAKYFSFSNRIASTDKALYYYRTRKSSISHNEFSLDFPQKCLYFVHAIEDYSEANCERNIDDFVSYSFLYMLMTSINWTLTPSVKNILKIIKLYDNDRPVSKVAVKRFSVFMFRGNGIRSKYFRLIIWLLRLRLFSVTAFFEKIRIKKTRKKSKAINYYD